MSHDHLPIVRTSERREFKRCPQRWWWSYRQGLRPRDEAKALWFGTGIHLALEHFYAPGGTKRGRSAIKVWREYAETGGTVTLPSGEVSDETEKPEYVNALALGEAMLGGYFELYGKDEHVYVLATELPFQMIIPGLAPKGPDSCIYTGKWDLLWRDLRYPGEPVLLSDHKTAADRSTNHLTLDDQAGSYWALAAQYLRAHKMIKPKEVLKGIEYNILLKYLPPVDERPVDADGMRLNKDGSVSKRQPKPLADRYLRERVHRTPSEQQTQIRRIAQEVEVMNLMRRHPELVYKSPTRDCSWDCAFFSMCELQERQSAWEEVRDLTFVVADPYADHREAIAE